MMNNLRNGLRLGIFSLILLMGTWTDANTQTIAFPGAEGFGKYTTGGRGGKVIEVTNLNNSGEGSLRAAIEASGPRTVVFLVSGTIHLSSTLKINNPDITIAGQTAPGDGITLAHYNFSVNANNVIIRYIRARLGDQYFQEADAFTCTENENIIIDHSTFSWSVDEVASAYLNKNFTMQYCIISESLYNSVHSKGPHGYGGIWGGSRASFHHNLIAHNTSRNPRFNGARYIGSPWEELVDFRNNVIYNWGFNSAYGGEPSEIDGIKANINVVNNYYKSGPGTRTGEVSYRLLDPYSQGLDGYSKWYVNGNKTYGFPDVFADNWGLGVQSVTTTEKDAMKVDTPFEYEITTIHNADEAYADVLLNAGVTIPRRDTIDKRIILEVETGTTTFGGTYGEGSGIIDSQEAVGGWPALFSSHAPIDSDHDGMPDNWEIVMSLDINNPEDRNGDHDADGYTNLEEYLNSITSKLYFINPPTKLSATLTGIKTVSLKWIDNSDDEDGFYIERKSIADFEIIDTTSENTESYIDINAVYGAEYFYRIRSFNDIDSSVYAYSELIQTLSETDPPLKAEVPSPEIGTQLVNVNTTISWLSGIGTSSHKIYLGTTNDPSFLTETTDTFVNISNLNYGEKYYWRIDEVNANGETPGDLWYFVTEVNMVAQKVGLWQFETMSKAVDSSIFENHGIYHNFLPYSISSKGAVGKALIFNGTSQYVEVPSSPVFNFNSNSFTITLWIKQNPADTDPSEEYRYLIKGSLIKSVQTGLSGKRYEIYHKPADNEVRFAIDDNTNESFVAAGEDYFVRNYWTHLTAVRDVENSELRIYSNGVLLNTAADATDDISQDENLLFGYDLNYKNYYKGLLDEIRLYNYAISQEEITGIVNMGPAGFYSAAVNEIPFIIFPNPAEDVITLKLIIKSPDAKIEIFDINGRIRLKEYVSKHELETGKRINISDLSEGFYLIKMVSNNQISRGRLIVK